MSDDKPDTTVPIPGGATITLRVPRRPPLPVEKASIIADYGHPTRWEYEGEDNILLHWDYRR
jgi:hypothetical protein